MTDPTSVALRVLDRPTDLPGTHFTDLIWEHRPLGPALATLLTGRDVFVHRRACDEDQADPRLPTLATVLESRGVEVGSDAGPLTRPRLQLDLPTPGGTSVPLARRGATRVGAAVIVTVAPNGLWVPGADRRLAGLVRLIDVTATVLDLFGMIDLGWEHAFQGQSVLDLSDASGTCSECYLTNCSNRGWRARDHEFWEPNLPEELLPRVRGYVRRRVAETGLVDPLVRLGPESPDS